MEQGEFEVEETKIFDNILPFFDLFINVGANTGYYVCRALSKGKDTIAFEPNQLNVNILLENINANKFSSNFQLFPIALGSRTGLIPMYGSSTGASLIKGWAGQYRSKLIPISKFDTLADSIINAKKCLFFVDIEGFELEFLKGAISILNADNHVFVIEISVSEHQPSGIKVNPNLMETFKLMFFHNYKAYTANIDLRRVEIKEIEKIIKTGENTLTTHNFLFIKNSLSLSKIGLKKI